MVNILAAVEGSTTDVIKPVRALLSVSDKTGVVDLAKALAGVGAELLSTGGTAKTLREAGLTVTEVSDYTGSAECLDGRVKTLHPKIHGGLLAVRGNAKHEADMIAQDIGKIDVTVVNLYPFQKTVQTPGKTFDECVENVDIGGPSMVRSSAKNHKYVAVVTSPAQYDEVIEALANGGTTLALRKKLAARAFALSASYDAAVAARFAEEVSDASIGPSSPVVSRVYQPVRSLKYGCNPHQKPAFVGALVSGASPTPKLPFEVKNGTPGYINLLDATNAWQLVKELRAATGLAAAASFKHVSPAGAAVAVPLTELEKEVYQVSSETEELTDVALAYVRARNADPLCSFGDFAAVSDVVDGRTAKFLKKEVSDGIVAPGYTTEALEILSQKKGGKFLVLEADPSYVPPDTVEYREVYGMAFAQRRNDRTVTTDDLGAPVTSSTSLSDDAKRDMVVASIGVKYTQSNSVGFATRGMMVGVGAGQQSRVDCVKLASRKVRTWMLRHHPKVRNLPFVDGTKRQDKVNARVAYIESGGASSEAGGVFSQTPESLTPEEADAFIRSFGNDETTGAPMVISSDAFFPFRDSVDVAAGVGVTHVVQPGGSVQDKGVIAACDDHGMTMCFTGIRLFHH